MATKTQKMRKATGATKKSHEKLNAVLAGGVSEPALTNVIDPDFKHQPANDDAIVTLDARSILSNAQNPRESAPALTQMGYGIFHKLPGSDKLAIVGLALSDKPEDRAEYVKLIVRFEEGIVHLAKNFRAIGMRQPVQVRSIPGGYDLIFGCRRLLAHLFNYNDEWEGKDAANYPATVRAIVCEANDERARLISLSENIHRLNMNQMEQARIFGRMKDSGIAVQEIADVTEIDHQVVRQRLQLLKLSPEMQTKVEEGELGVVKALKLIKGKEKGKGTPSGHTTGKGHTGDGSRRKAPSVKDMQTMYEEREPDGVFTESVRKWIAQEVLQVEYMDYKKLSKEKEAVAAKQAEAAKRNGEK